MAKGWTDQVETWHAGRPRPWPHCVRWGPSSPSPKGGKVSQFSSHVYCGQIAACVKMPLGMVVGLGSGHIVLDGDPARPPQKGAQPPIFGPCFLWPNGWMDQNATWYDVRPLPGQHCVRCRPSSTPPRCTAPKFRSMSVVGKWLDGSRWHLVQR